MNVDRTTQALLTSPANLHMGVVQVNTGQDHHYIADASFNTNVEYKEVKLGYPARTVKLLPNRLGATASLTTENMIAAKALLTSISDSTVLPAPPNVPLSMIAHAPVGTGLTLSLLNSVLLQQFSIALNNDDFYSMQFEFESTGQVGSWAELITVSQVGTSGAFLANIDSTRLAIGMPRISVNGVSVGAVTSLNLSMSTEYRRLEIGMPAVLKQLLPLAYDLSLSFSSEEFDDSFAVNYSTEVDIEIKFSTIMTITFKAKAQASQGKLTPAEFSSAEISYRATVQTANKLFTIV